MKAVWFAEDEIKEPMKCEVCGKTFKEGFIVEPENQEDVKRLQKRFPFVTDLHHFILARIACIRISVVKQSYSLLKALSF